MSNNRLIPQLRFPEFKNEGRWEEKKLGDIAENLDSKRIPITSTQREKGSIPYYGASGIIDYVKDYIFDETLLCISEDGANLLDRNYPIAFTILGKTWVNNHSHVLRFKNFDTQILVEKYFNSINVQDFLTGMAQPKLNRGKLDIIPIPLPENSQEQQKIASCLSSLDEVIAAHSQKLDLLKEHKKGLMQNLFPQEGEKVPKYRFKEFENDGEWVEKKLGEVAEVGRGKSKHRPRDDASLYGGRYPFVQTGDIKKADLYLTEFSQTYSEKGLKQSKLWNENTLCITIAANIAETAILKIKACFPDSIIGLTTNEKEVNILFIKYSFDVFKEKIQSLSQGVAQENLNQEKLSNIEFAFPSPKEQQKIASCLSSLDALITAEAEKIAQLKWHKKGLMQGLFPKIND